MAGAEVARRLFLRGAGAAAAAAVLAACARSRVRTASATAEPVTQPRPRTAEEALARLMEGNRRFAAGSMRAPGRSAARRTEVASGQNPWAVVLGCVDSRVAPEILFDEGLGDLMVVRSAGQALDDVVLGSVEFGAEEFDTPLVLVLGHERCGAVTATVEAIENNARPAGAVAAVVDAIRPAVAEAKRAQGNLVENAVRANVRMQVQRLRSSPALRERIGDGRVEVVGAYYDLDRGDVQVIARQS